MKRACTTPLPAMLFLNKNTLLKCLSVFVILSQGYLIFYKHVCQSLRRSLYSKQFSIVVNKPNILSIVSA